MTSSFRIKAKRTTGTGPPPDGLEFGELAFSDADETLHLGKADNSILSFPLVPGSSDWADITGKPTTFPPSEHTQDWSTITGKPATFPPEAHTHPGILYDTVGDVETVSPALGHRWFETAVNRGWYWSGSLWLSVELYWVQRYFFNISSTQTPNSQYQLPPYENLFLESIFYQITAGHPFTDTDYWLIRFRVWNGNPQDFSFGLRPSEQSLASNLMLVNQAQSGSTIVAGSINGLDFIAVKMLSPPNLTIRLVAKIREIRR